MALTLPDSHCLMPLAQKWPAPSKTNEVLLTTLSPKRELVQSARSRHQLFNCGARDALKLKSTHIFVHSSLRIIFVYLPAKYTKNDPSVANPQQIEIHWMIYSVLMHYWNRYDGTLSASIPYNKVNFHTSHRLLNTMVAHVLGRWSTASWF